MENIVTHDRGVTAGLVKSWLKLRFGEERLKTVLGKLSPDARDMLENTSSNHWYPISLMKELYSVIYKEFEAEDPKALRDHGRFAAERSATGLLRYLMKFIDMDTIIKRMNTFWKHYHKGGEIVAGELVEQSGRKRRLISIHGYDPGEPGCLIQEGYFEAIAERAGAKRIEVKKKSCIHHGDSCCSWELSWE